MPLRPVSDGTPHRVRILVVDDEPAVRSSLRRQLEGAGYDVVEASDGRCVVATVVREGVALVVTDVVMPHHDGMETIQELRRACPTIPVIAISARGQDYLDVARAFGACYAFAKPFESELFVQTVTKVISTLNAA